MRTSTERADDTAALIDRALGGDADSAARLVERLLPVIAARARRARYRFASLRAVEERDLVNDVWLILLAQDGQKLRAWRPEGGATLEGFVGMIAEREMWSLNEKQTTKKRGLRALNLDDVAEVPQSAPNPEVAAVNKDTVARLQKHLEANLSKKGQVFFRYLYTDERSPDEVATVLGVSRQVVYNWQHKIRGLARSFIAAHQ